MHLLVDSWEKCLDVDPNSGKLHISLGTCQWSLVWSMGIVLGQSMGIVSYYKYGQSMGIVWGHLSVGHIGRSMYLEQATPAIGCWQGSAGCDAGLGCSPKQVMAVAQSHPSTPHLLAHPPLCHAYTLTFASTKEPNEPTCLPTLVPYIIMHLPIYKGTK